MSTNDKLDELTGTVSDLAGSVTSSLGTTGGAVSYYGKTVEAEGSTTPFQNGEAAWEYDIVSAAASLKLIVTDSSGNLVNSEGYYLYGWAVGVGGIGPRLFVVRRRRRTPAPIGNACNAKGARKGCGRCMQK